MQNWQEEQLQVLLSIQCEHELFAALTGMARELGFDYCAYGLRTPLPLSRPNVVMFNNYPVAWQARYREKNYLDIDPTVHHGTHSLLPILWSEEVFTSARELWEDARSFGLHVGRAQSIRDVNGVAGMLTLARSEEPLSNLELRDKGLKMAWLAHVAHLGMSHCLNAKQLRESGARLTNQERAVLRWSADGKTSAQIADILGISERTVNFHINNAIQKLGTANKLAATVKAAVLGMLA